MKHTKGPWYLDQFGDLKSDSSKSTRNLVPFYGVLNGSEEAKANSALIAAAPDLLEALKQCAACIAWREFGDCRVLEGKQILTSAEAFEIARAAIAKAEWLE